MGTYNRNVEHDLGRNIERVPSHTLFSRIWPLHQVYGVSGVRGIVRGRGLDTRDGFPMSVLGVIYTEGP